MVLTNHEECQVGTRKFSYFYLPQDRKRFRISVHPNTDIMLHCPLEAQQAERQEVISKKWQWIERQQKYFARFSTVCPKPRFISGSEFRYLGKQYRIKVKKGLKNEVQTVRTNLQVTTTKEVGDEDFTKKVVDSWVHQQTKLFLRERYEFLCAKFDVKNKPVLKLRQMKKRWGSNVAGKVIYINPQLIKADARCIDYVILHEICHLEVQNHNTRFLTLLDSRMPKWRTYSKKLDYYI